MDFPSFSSNSSTSHRHRHSTSNNRPPQRERTPLVWQAPSVATRAENTADEIYAEELAYHHTPAARRWSGLLRNFLRILRHIMVYRQHVQTNDIYIFRRGGFQIIVVRETLLPDHFH
jgi:hypothetical protein